jgi:hypothetical protein
MASASKEGNMESGVRIVAIGLLTGRDLEVLGQGFKRVFPLDGSTDFSKLLDAIDEAERLVESAEDLRP